MLEINPSIMWINYQWYVGWSLRLCFSEYDRIFTQKLKQLLCLSYFSSGTNFHSCTYPDHLLGACNIDTRLSHSNSVSKSETKKAQTNKTFFSWEDKNIAMTCEIDPWNFWYCDSLAVNDPKSSFIIFTSDRETEKKQNNKKATLWPCETGSNRCYLEFPCFDLYVGYSVL